MGSHVTIGLGDGPNDAPLLDTVNFAIVVKAEPSGSIYNMIRQSGYITAPLKAQRGGVKAWIMCWVTVSRRLRRKPDYDRYFL
jgi:predicted mannosyl-3-phosphoglycerate phosphatase (HAD superfamily)